MIFRRRTSTAAVLGAAAGSFSSALRAAQGQPEPVRTGPPPGMCECGHRRRVHKPLKRFRPKPYGCSLCLCLTQPESIERDPHEPGFISRTGWANFAAAVGAEGMGDYFAEQAEKYNA